MDQLDKDVLIKKLEGLCLLYGVGEVTDILLDWLRYKLDRYFVLKGE